MRRLAALALTLALPLGLPGLAAAVGPFEATGSYAPIDSTISNFHYAGAVAVFDETVYSRLTGTLSGTSTLELSCVVPPTGKGYCHGSQLFTGTVAGRPGTVTFHNVNFFDVTTDLSSGELTVTGATGDLAGLHGHGTIAGDGSGGRYQFTLVFAGG